LNEVAEEGPEIFATAENLNGPGIYITACLEYEK
jgi:hypothetical protein